MFSLLYQNFFIEKFSLILSNEYDIIRGQLLTIGVLDIMKLVRLIGLIIKAILFILLVVLATQNMQTVKVSLFTYSLDLPLIAILALFLVGGLIFGLILGFLRSLSYKQEINKLKKQLSLVSETSSKSANS
jgi:uncharacterized integral membrane protein